MANNTDFTYNEAALALTTLVAWANGELKDSQIDTRVQMILDEKISQTEIEDFKIKYDSLQNNDTIYQLATSALEKESLDSKARVCSWMWEVANVSTKKEHKVVDLSYLEEETEWQNKNTYVDIEELNLINKTRKDLGVTLEKFKESFAALPKAKRI